jgi:hypothetical protein
MDGQIPWLAGQEEENHPAHPGMGEERSLCPPMEKHRKFMPPWKT